MLNQNDFFEFTKIVNSENRGQNKKKYIPLFFYYFICFGKEKKIKKGKKNFYYYWERKKNCFLLLLELGKEFFLLLGKVIIGRKEWKIVFIFNTFRNFIYMNFFFLVEWSQEKWRDFSFSVYVLSWNVEMWFYRKIFFCTLASCLLTCRSLMFKVHYRKFACLFIFYVLLLL